MSQKHKRRFLHESVPPPLELPFGADESDVHLVRMMVSDRIENNPHAWEVLIDAYLQEE